MFASWFSLPWTEQSFLLPPVFANALLESGCQHSSSQVERW